MSMHELLQWQQFNNYVFQEDIHTYFYEGRKVDTSVTTFISRYFPEFDSETISAKYAAKHGMTQEAVLAEWKRKGDISAIAGTAIHAWLENAKRGKILRTDFGDAEKLGILPEVEERYNILLPKAQAFHRDTLGKLFPIHLEYTVGVEDFIAGNVDMLCWNEHAQEVQIWDYKNVKELSRTNSYGNMCKFPFHNYYDCSFIHYCIQLNFYKAIIYKVLGIRIGKCYLVHFDYTKNDDSFEIVPCLDLMDVCKKELDKHCIR